MPKQKPQQTEPLSQLPIFEIRGQRVILDTDLARIYGVETKKFNQAIKRNRDRFPADFAFQLTVEEHLNLRSQFVTSSLQIIDSENNTANWSQFVTSSQGGRRYLPWAFTEHGCLMAATVQVGPTSGTRHFTDQTDQTDHKMPGPVLFETRKIG